jgi:hypothetical protein
MDAESGSRNLDRLIDAGVIPGRLPEPYDMVIDGLSDEEIDALIAVKRKLDDANSAYGGRGDAGFIGMVVPL